MDVIEALDMKDEPRTIRGSFASDFASSELDEYEYVWTRNQADRKKEFTLNGDPVDIIELSRTNEFNAGTIKRLRALGPGESVRFGGQGCMEVKRVA